MYASHAACSKTASEYCFAQLVLLVAFGSFQHTIMEYEYCRVPDEIVDPVAMMSFKNAVPQASWLNLGPQASLKVEMGRQHIFLFIGDYASAGLKYNREYVLSDGSVVYEHCRGQGRVILRVVGTVVIGTMFKPMPKVCPMAEAGCVYSYAVSGQHIGLVRVSQSLTIGGLLAEIATEMRSRGLVSLQCNVKLAFAELPDDDGKKMSKNMLLRNCDAVKTDMIANDHMCPGVAEVFLNVPKKNGKKEKKVDDKIGQKGSKDKMVKKGGAAKK